MPANVERYPGCEVFDFKGRDMILLNQGQNRRFQFGVDKARLVLANWDAVVAFATAEAAFRDGEPLAEDYCGCPVEEFKGNPVLVLNPDAAGFKRMSFGFTKAGILKIREEALQHFVADKGGAT